MRGHFLLTGLVTDPLTILGRRIMILMYGVLIIGWFTTAYKFALDTPIDVLRAENRLSSLIIGLCADENIGLLNRIWVVNGQLGFCSGGRYHCKSHPAIRFWRISWLSFDEVAKKHYKTYS